MNPNQSLIKVFVVKYDLNAMPAGHRTFVRQRYRSRETSVTRHAIHINFVTGSRGSLYLAGDIRVLFSPRCTDEALDMESLHPGEPRFAPATQAAKSG